MEDEQQVVQEPATLRSRRRLVGVAAGAVLVVGAAAGGIAVVATSSGASTQARNGIAGAPGSTGGANAPTGEGLPGNGGMPGGEGGMPGGPGGGARGGMKPTASGTVASVDAAADAFVLKESSGAKVTIDVTTSTTYLDPGVTSPSLTDVTAGATVSVVGTRSSGTIKATRVMIGGFGRPGGSQSGQGFGAGGPSGATGSWGPPA